MKNKCLLFMLCLIVVLCACNPESGENKVPNLTDESQLQFYMPGNTRKMAESSTHYYRIVGTYLYAISKKDGQVRVVDNNPDSLDDLETNPERLRESHAYFYLPQSVQYIMNKLYVWSDEPVEKTGEELDSSENTISVLYEVDPGGGPQKKIHTFNEKIYDLLIHKGYIYYTTSDATVVLDKILNGDLSNEQLEALYYHVKRIPLEHPNQDADILYSKQGYNTFFTYLTAKGTDLYFTNSGGLGTPEIDEKVQRCWRSDLNSLQTQTLSVGSIRLVNGGMISVKAPSTPPISPEDALATSDSILLYDKEGQFKEDVRLQRAVYAYSLTYSFGEYVCKDNLVLAIQIPGVKRILQIVRTDGQFIAEVEVPEEFRSGMLMGMTDNSIFLEAPSPEGGSYTEIYQLNFLNGQKEPQWEPFFTYQPHRVG